MTEKKLTTQELENVNGGRGKCEKESILSDIVWDNTPMFIPFNPEDYDD